MPRMAVVLALALAAFASPVAAQSAPAPAKLAGAWDFSFDTPQGGMTWRVTFEQAADTLRGVASSDLGTLQLAGMVRGNDFSFTVTVPYEGQTFELVFAGKAEERTAAGNIDVPAAGMQIPFAAKRVAQDARPRLPE